MKKLMTALMIALFIPMGLMAKPNKQTVTFYVNLHCEACVDKVMKNIAYEKGVKDIVCSLEKQTVVVTYDANKTDVKTLQAAFEKLGKPASLTPPHQCPHSGQSCSHDGCSHDHK